MNAPDDRLETPEERRARIAPGTPAGVTEAMIAELVTAFYAKARRDPLLGPVFNAKVEDWPAHLSKIADFWSSVMLLTGRFRGAPRQVHMMVGETAGPLTPAHFVRWLELWRETARALCPPAAAALFVEKAEMIGANLQLGLFRPDPGSGPPVSRRVVSRRPS